MTKEDLVKIADLLAYVHLPSIVLNCTAIGVQDVLKDINLLQKALRDQAEKQN
jgi:hypothetical protein